MSLLLCCQVSYASSSGLDLIQKSYEENPLEWVPKKRRRHHTSLRQGLLTRLHEQRRVSSPPLEMSCDCVTSPSSTEESSLDMTCEEDDDIDVTTTASEYEALRRDRTTLDVAYDGHVIWSKTVPGVAPFDTVRDLELNIEILAAVLFTTQRCSLDVAARTICDEIARNVTRDEHVAYIIRDLQRRLQ